MWQTINPSDVRWLTPEALGALGGGQVLYVKPVVVNGEAAVALHAADGSPLAVAPSRDLAMAVALQNDMIPLSVH